MRTIITLKSGPDGKTRVTREKLFERFKARGGRRALDGPREIAAYKEGYSAAKGGTKKAECPYPQGNPLRGVWLAGFGYQKMGDPSGPSFEQLKPPSMTGFDSKDNVKDFGEMEPTVRAYQGKFALFNANGKILAYSARREDLEQRLEQERSKHHEGRDAKDLFIGTRGLGQEREEGYIDKAYDSVQSKEYWKLKPLDRSAVQNRAARLFKEAGESGMWTYAPDSTRTKYFEQAMEQLHGAQDAAPRKRIVIHNHLPRVKDDSISTLKAQGRQLIGTFTKSIDVRDWCDTQGLTRAEESIVVTAWKQARMEAGLSENV